jgi:uncharacterized membrane protein YbhN (UPF0104 family)
MTAKEVFFLVLRVSIAAAAITYCAYLISIEWNRAVSYPALSLFCLSALLYVAALTFCAWFWKLCLKDLGAHPSWLGILAAYFAGHVAKYLPGKVWVIFVRTSWLSRDGVSLGRGAFSVAQETLLFMGTGGLWGGLLLWGLLGSHLSALGRWIATAAVVSGVLMCLSISPSVTRRLSRWSPPWPAEERIGWGTFRIGLVLTSGAWAGLAASSGLLLQDSLGVGPPWLLVPLWLSAVATSTCLGFLSLLPGGLGSRELVLIAVLKEVGHPWPAIAAGSLRLAWLTAELVAAVSFWGAWQLYQPGRSVEQ